jgi:hypothetical protein
MALDLAILMPVVNECSMWRAASRSSSTNGSNDDTRELLS